MPIVMSDPLGNPLRKPPALPPSVKPPPEDDEAINLLDGSAEPTDDSPTVISKAAQPQPAARIEDNAGHGLRGRHLAHFELIEPIGVGGMAAVLRARDTQLDRLVALKILPPEMAVDPENIRRFHHEARSAARLDHENIARVFFCGEDQRLHFIAFEFVEGDNLRTILEKRGRLPVGEALHYMLQVAAGLAHAARRGVVHRDIKPSNIIVTPNGRAKLVDMGLARSLEPQHDQGLTQSGVTLGTFDYISPEQALEPRDADVRSDIYSLGCTFYHMLTGHPPVPEGTPARKLQHHQHVKPDDPRQFVPDLPDEVAVILDRMMAKQPKDRYQTPEHLVHHLYLAARKLGAAGEVPEGVLAVEAALPSPPAGRPLVLVAVAAIAVVALIFLADAASTPKPEPAPNPAVEVGTALPKPKEPDPSPPSPATSNPAAPAKPIETLKPKVATFSLEKPTVAALAEWVRQNEKEPQIILEWDELVLRDDGPDLVIANPTVTIRPYTHGRRAIIRDQYRDRLPQRFQASLTIKSKSCTIENMRFVLNQTGASVPMAMLWFNGAQKVHLHRCEFFQANPCRDKDRNSHMTSIQVEAEADRPTTLRVTESCFLGFGSLGTRPADGEQEFSSPALGGQDALTRNGPVQIETTNCLFGPHAAVFRLEGSAANDAGLVRLTNCSVLATNPSTVFDLANDADAKIDARYCLFCSPDDPGMTSMGESSGAILVRRASTQGAVTYEGHDNRYHHFGYLAIADAPKETVQRLLADMAIRGSEELETPPWKDAQPLNRLKDQVRPADIRAAFEVNPRLAELRVSSNRNRLIGAERVLTFCYTDNLPPLKESPATTAHERIVRKGARLDENKLVFPTLDYALVEARSGDTIRLQLDGEIKIDPRLLNREKAADLTIRADPGFHPVLVLAAEEAGDAAPLIEIGNGKLQLEGLELRLAPRRDGDLAAVFSFLGDGECLLKGCLITLQRSPRRASLAVLPLKRLKKALPSTDTPRLLLDRCFVRGHGDLLSLQGSYSAEVVLDNSLVALTGSLLNIEADKNDAKEETPVASPEVALRLKRVTTYLGENLIRLRAAKDIKKLPATRCEAVACLFLPARDRSLVRLEGPDGEDKSLREKFTWESNGKNAYGAFTALLEQQDANKMRMSVTAGQTAWQSDVSREMSSQYNVKLPEPPAAGASFTQLRPPAFRPTEDAKEYGADLVALNSLAAFKEGKELPDELDFPEFGAEEDADSSGADSE